jgi:hypothetical protein
MMLLARIPAKYWEAVMDVTLLVALIILAMIVGDSLIYAALAMLLIVSVVIGNLIEDAVKGLWHTMSCDALIADAQRRIAFSKMMSFGFVPLLILLTVLLWPWLVHAR